MVPVPEIGRVYVHAARPGLGDVTPDRRGRLDSIARWVQDAAYADVDDSAVPDDGVWVVRRLTLDVERWPEFWEPLEIATFCSGTGRLWAERRTTIRGECGALVEAVAVWVHLDPAGMRPLALPDGFDAVFGPSANGRRVRARLHLPAEPPDGAAERAWSFRESDLDMARHVNNAVYWAVLEEELAGADPGPGYVTTVEHRAPAGPGPARVLAAGPHRWIADESGAVLATFELPTG
jgi:acyl-ACP thioesterase